MHLKIHKKQGVMAHQYYPITDTRSEKVIKQCYKFENTVYSGIICTLLKQEK